MIIQPLSDLHLDCHKDGGKGFLKSLDPSGVDVLVVAGDLAEVLHEGFGGMLRALCEKYPQVVYVPGNHEFWHGTRQAVLGVLDKVAGEIPNLHILQERVVVLEGQRFVGTPLWFHDGDTARMRAKRWIDFKRITGFDDWVWEASKKAEAFLMSEVKPGDVVVTHYLPLHKSLDERYCGRDGKRSDNCFFLHDMSPIFERGGPALWIHGHTHVAMNYPAGNTRVVCNPLGYAMEPTGFDDELRVGV